MKTSRITLLLALFGLLSTTLISCFENEDAGPMQHQEKEFSMLDFERLEIGDALNVTVEQSNIFSVVADGDRRNIDDLVVEKIGNTLRIILDNPTHRYNRQYTTYIKIRMPVLDGVTFSGAVVSKITGFESQDNFDLNLSGASTCQVDIDAPAIKVSLSGASECNMSGTTDDLDVNVSGASKFSGFDLESATATVDASGASSIRVLVTQKLNAKASGASEIRYRGNATISSSTSGASVIRQD